ncbi:MAG: cation-translocating P-type ATPase [Anaerolineae bacterium]|nr:cation-translocating P-type ATPase [Anaerolineae bacterium]
MGTARSEIVYRIDGMDCANCALTLERSVSQLEGVDRVQVNFTTATLEAVGTLDPEAIEARVRALGYHVRDPQDGQDQAHAAETGQGPGVLRFLRYLWRDRVTALALIGALMLLAALPLTFLPASPALDWVVRALHIAVTVLAGHRIAWKGLRALLVARQITIDLLMTVAATGAVLIGETGEAATVVVLFAIGEALEGYSAERARDSLKSLLALRPDQATVLRPCVDCQEHMGKEGYTGGPCPTCGVHEALVPVEQVRVGETIVVRPGDRIPLDGRVRSGASAVNQAPVTGESIPVRKDAGDEVYAGTINGEAALEIETTRPAADSTISRIVRLVERAQAERSPIERQIDRFARWYTPAVVLVAVLVAAIPPLLFGAPFLDGPDGARGWLYRALSLLIVACPCSLVISTPVTVVSAMTSLARRGVLVKGGAFLDALAEVRAFALDKTGTLTEGRPSVIEVRTPNCPALELGPEESMIRCDACDEMLAIASSVERRSEHPLAHAILSEAERRDLLRRYPAAESVEALAGRGVEGTLNDARVTVGSHALFHEQEAECVLHDMIAAAEEEGRTVIVVGQEGRVLGYVGVADILRESSRDALRALKQIVPGAHVAMLTGDAPAVAHAIGDQVGQIDEIQAGLLPDAKLHAIQALRVARGPVAMIGDGVNDAPALAAADVGIAMGGAGTAQAMETADLVLMQDDLSRLPDAIETSQRTRTIIAQNIVFSLGVKLAILALALVGLAPLWLAVFADVGTSLLVTINGMRMLRTRDRAAVRTAHAPARTVQTA